MNYIALAVIALGTASPVSEPSRVQPVRVGVHGQADLDACLGFGTTTSVVAARLAPHRSASVVTSLRAGQVVHLCGTSDDGEWESVVFPAEGGQDCGVSRPVPAPQPYSGPCRSGWVPGNRVTVVAG